MSSDVEAMAADVVLLIQRAMAPVIERLAKAEALLSTAVDLRDRVVAVETKSATPLQQDPVLGEMRDRLLVLETKSALGVSPDSAEITSMRERLATLEARAPVPGPPGADGQNGKDGADGLGFEDLDVSLSGDRTLVFRFAKGEQEKKFAVDVAWPKYQRQWEKAKSYVLGDLVSFDGHVWACQADTTGDQPGVSQVWYRAVMRGARGQDGKDGRDVLQMPVVKVGGS